MKRTRREYDKQFYMSKSNNLHKTDKTLKNRKLPKLTQDEIENLLSPKKTGFVVKTSEKEICESTLFCW